MKLVNIEPFEIRQTKGRISPSDILLGKPIPKIDRLKIMSEDEFEELVYEWVQGYLKNEYKEVMRLGGAGDKGRDVIGFREDGLIDIFQCKHYSNQISPSDIWIEFGKLCYYCFKEVFNIPSNYFIVSTRGIGPKLFDLLQNPDKLKNGLKLKWDATCSTKIIKGETIELEENFLNYIEAFPFNIIKSVEPLTLIEQHHKTIYHPARFGGGLIKTRSGKINISEDIEERELTYINCLLEVYGEELGISISDHNQLQKQDKELYQHFTSQRYCFYSAESLERFSRDHFFNSDPLPFDELKDESKSIILNTFVRLRNEPGLKRMAESISSVEQQQFSNNALRDEITALDKGGLCHHLVNDGEIESWCRKT